MRRMRVQALSPNSEQRTIVLKTEIGFWPPGDKDTLLILCCEGLWDRGELPLVSR